MENTQTIINVMICRLALTLIVLWLISEYLLPPPDSHKYIPTLLVLFIITIYVSDFMDCAVITKDRKCKSSTYQIADKLCDQGILAYWTFVIIPKISPDFFVFISALWYFRSIGIILYLITGERRLFVIFANYTEVAILISVLNWWRYPILVILLFLIKFGQEILLHSGLVNYLDFRDKITNKVKNLDDNKCCE